MDFTQRHGGEEEFLTEAADNMEELYLNFFCAFCEHYFSKSSAPLPELLNYDEMKKFID